MRAITFLGFLVLLCSSVLATEPGLTPCDAIPIQNFESFSVSVFGSSEPIWYSLVSSQALSLKASTCNAGSSTTFDSVLSVYTGDCDFPVLLASNDDDPSCQVYSRLSTLSWTSEVGSSYFLVLTAFSQPSATYKYQLSVSSESLQSCDDAVAIPAPYHPAQLVEFDLSQADTFPLSVCGLSSGSYVLWYTIQPVAGTPVTVSTCGSEFDTVVYIFNGECTDLNCVASNDDSTTCGQGSLVSFAPDGNVYYVGVYGYGNLHSGFGVLNISQTILNVGCDNAWGPFTATTTLQGLQGSTVNAAPLLSNNLCGVSGPAQWLSFRAQLTGQFTLSTCVTGTAFSTVLSAYQGSCEDLTCYVPPTPNDCPLGDFASISFPVHTGDTFLVSLSGLNGAVGVFDLTFIIQ